MSKSKLNSKDLKALERLVTGNDSVFSLESCLFPQQLKFVRDVSRFKTAVCTRRSGKSVACAVDLLHTAINNPGTTSLYITLSRLNGKRIIWPILREYNRRFNLGGTENETEVSMTLPNGSIIYVAGAKDKEQIEKFRGLALKKVYLDEAQSFPPFIEGLVDEVLAPALFDYNGSLILIGTPGPIPSGYFYECSTSPQWAHHFWSIFNNPFIDRKSGRTPQSLLDEELTRRGVEVTNPKIQREFFGQWTLDLDCLVFRYSEATCHFNDIPAVVSEWNYVIGIDLGFNDADAIAVLAYNKQLPEAYLIQEVIAPKQTITELINTVQSMVEKYKPEQIVIDTGGLGKKIAEELMQRYQIPLKAAEKTRKYENIELLNDALTSGRLRIKKDSRFAFDSKMVEWDSGKLRPDKMVISDRYHSDICDAVLYAFRELYHWLYEKPAEKVVKGSEAYWKQQVEGMEQAALDQLIASKANEDDIYE